MTKIDLTGAPILLVDEAYAPALVPMLSTGYHVGRTIVQYTTSPLALVDAAYIQALEASLPPEHRPTVLRLTVDYESTELVEGINYYSRMERIVLTTGPQEFLHHVYSRDGVITHAKWIGDTPPN